MKNTRLKGVLLSAKATKKKVINYFTFVFRNKITKFFTQILWIEKVKLRFSEFIGFLLSIFCEKICREILFLFFLVERNEPSIQCVYVYESTHRRIAVKQIVRNEREQTIDRRNTNFYKLHTFYFVGQRKVINEISHQKL